MVRRANEDARLKRSEGTARADRAATDRPVTQNRVLTDEERLNEFRQTFFHSALPDIPGIDGFHVCWLTTTNPRDPIHARMRLGYEPIKASDIPGWDFASLKTGEYAGCIGVNEMVAFKLPLHLYEAYMKEAHHNQPLAEEKLLVAKRQQTQDEMSQVARRQIILEVEEGSAELGKEVEAPSFEETLTDRARRV